MFVVSAAYLNSVDLRRSNAKFSSRRLRTCHDTGLCNVCEEEWEKTHRGKEHDQLQAALGF